MFVPVPLRSPAPTVICIVSAFRRRKWPSKRRTHSKGSMHSRRQQLEVRRRDGEEE